MSDAVMLHPEWRNALAAIVASDPQPGDLIRREDLERMLELPEAHSIDQFHARQLKWLQQFERLRDELLVVHKIWMRANGSGCYEFVPPAQQTEAAYSDYSRQALNKLKRMVRIAQNVRLSELTDTERRANADALAKMSMLVGMVGVARLEGKSTDGEE